MTASITATCSWDRAHHQLLGVCMCICACIRALCCSYKLAGLLHASSIQHRDLSILQADILTAALCIPLWHKAQTLDKAATCCSSGLHHYACINFSSAVDGWCLAPTSSTCVGLGTNLYAGLQAAIPGQEHKGVVLEHGWHDDMSATAVLVQTSCQKSQGC